MGPATCAASWRGSPSFLLAVGQLPSGGCARIMQEDAHAVALDLEGVPTTGFFAVFDGHGGKEVAKYAALHMVRAGPHNPHCNKWGLYI